MAKTLLGMEIGNYRIKIAIVHDGKLQDLCVAELPDHLIRDGQIVSWDAMADFIRETVKEQHIAGKNVAVVLPEELTYIRRIMMPAMTVDQLKVNLPYEFHDYISQDKDQYFYDYAVLEMNMTEEGAPKNMELLAVAAKKSVIEQYKAMLKRAGLKLILAAPEAAAYQNVIRKHRTDTEGDERDYAILDIGHSSVKLHIYSKGNYEITRSIEPGLAELTEIIAELFNVDSHIAEIYKQQNQDGLWKHEACFGLYNRIAVELMRVLNFYSFNNLDNNLDTIYYCGGGALITPLMETIRETISQELISIDQLFPAGSGDAKELIAGAAAEAITWQ